MCLWEFSTRAGVDDNPLSSSQRLHWFNDPKHAVATLTMRLSHDCAKVNGLGVERHSILLLSGVTMLGGFGLPNIEEEEDDDDDDDDEARRKKKKYMQQRLNWPCCCAGLSFGYCWRVIIVVIAAVPVC